MSLDLSTALRARLLQSPAINGSLPTFALGYPVFTRRPVPTDAPYPMIVISGDISITDEDGVDDLRPIVTRDITVYGRNENPTKYRLVESLGYVVRDLFHSVRQSLSVQGYNIVDVRALGPRIAPTDDEQTVGRVVTLRIRLATPGIDLSVPPALPILPVPEQVIYTDAEIFLEDDAADIIIVKPSPSSPVTVHLPPSGNRNGRPIRIVDGGFNAQTNNITILPYGSETIMGGASWIIDSNGASIEFTPFDDGTGWF